MNAFSIVRRCLRITHLILFGESRIFVALRAGFREVELEYGRFELVYPHYFMCAVTIRTGCRTGFSQLMAYAVNAARVFGDRRFVA